MNRANQIADEISYKVPIFLRHMFPFVFNPINLPPSQVVALVSIQEHESCTLSTLCKEMHVSAPTISGIVDRLKKGGYIKRVQDLNDRRVINVSLTKKGEDIVQQLRDNIRNRWSYILSKMPIESAEILLKIMSQITQGFKDGSI